MHITDECINCEACNSECTNDAIHNAGDGYVIGGKAYPALSDDHTYIVPELCNSCGSCKEACSIGAIED